MVILPTFIVNYELELDLTLFFSTHSSQFFIVCLAFQLVGFVLCTIFEHLHDDCFHQERFYKWVLFASSILHARIFTYSCH
jgi:hypothetical protein